MEKKKKKMKEKLKELLREERICSYDNDNTPVYFTEIGENDFVDKIVSILMKENRDQKLKDLGI